MKSVRELKNETDEKYKDLKRAISAVSKLEQDLIDAKNRNSFQNIQRLESHLATARTKRDDIRRDYNEAQRAEFGVWVPQSKDCTDEGEEDD